MGHSRLFLFAFSYLCSFSIGFLFFLLPFSFWFVEKKISWVQILCCSITNIFYTIAWFFFLTFVRVCVQELLHHTHLLCFWTTTYIQFSSVQSLSRVWLFWDPMNCSTPGLPVHHQLPEFTQTDIHRVSDAIQPSHPVVPFSSCPQSLSASESFPMSQLFAWGWPKYGVSALASFLPKKSQGWSPCSPRDSQESSPTPQFKSISSSALSLLHSPALASIHDHRKNHSLD